MQLTDFLTFVFGYGLLLGCLGAGISWITAFCISNLLSTFTRLSR